MKKAMISMPMAGRTSEEIVAARNKAIHVLEGYGPLCFLAKSLEEMSKCHCAYFCKGWDADHVRGCKIEHDAAKAYGLEIVYEK